MTSRRLTNTSPSGDIMSGAAAQDSRSNVSEDTRAEETR